jgi:hypoxanthine phosphoribosyltransferase
MIVNFLRKKKSSSKSYLAKETRKGFGKEKKTDRKELAQQLVLYGKKCLVVLDVDDSGEDV